MSDNEDCDILFRPGLTAVAIADVLRSNPSPTFCKILAGMIAPTDTKPPYRLKLSKRRGRPMRDDGGKKKRVGEFMAGRVDDDGIKFEDAVCDAWEQFSVGETYANEALGSERLFRLDATSRK